MKARMLTFLVAALSMLPVVSFNLCAQGTAFTYQGRLDASGAPATGNYDFRFGLCTNGTAGNPTGSLLTNAATVVSNGLFTTTLDFSNAFTGAPYWLEIGVRTNGSTAAFTTLAPRQAITPAPYAITAGNATNLIGPLPAAQLSGPLPAGFLSGLYSNSVSFTNTANTFVGSGTGLTGLITPTQGNYVFAYDTSVQYIAAANTFQYLTFNTATTISGWSVSGNELFTPSQTGLYLVEYQVHVQNAGAGVPACLIRGVLNTSTVIAGSEAITSVIASNGIGLLSKSFLLPISAGQNLSFQIAANLASPYFYTVSGSFAGDTFPGITVTIVRLQ